MTSESRGTLSNVINFFLSNFVGLMMVGIFLTLQALVLKNLVDFRNTITHLNALSLHTVGFW